MHSIGADFRHTHTFRKFEKGVQTFFFRKKNFSEKSEEIRAFDAVTNLLRNLGL
jgi:hypothetical protein